MQTMAPPAEVMEQVDERIAETKREIKEEVKEVKEGVKELKQEMKALQITFQRGNFALVASVIGVLLATVLKGG